MKVGVLYDFSGLYADIGGPGAVAAAKMAVEDVEMGKAVRGEVVWADHQNKPDVAVNIVRRWYDQDRVDAIFGIGNSGIALAISEISAAWASPGCFCAHGSVRALVFPWTVCA